MQKKHKIFITGHNGMVGSAILKQFRDRKNIKLITISKNKLNLLNQTKVNKFFKLNSIETVIFCSAKVGGNIRKTSDEFFSQNKKYFDCIFIDGLHEYEQVKKDIINSLEYLNDGGVIFVHDCLPRSYFEQAVPRSQHVWTGDVWKSIVEFRGYNYLDICVGKLDMGLGIILKRKNSNKLSISIKNFKNLKYKEFFKNYENYLNLIHYTKIIKFIG